MLNHEEAKVQVAFNPRTVSAYRLLSAFGRVARTCPLDHPPSPSWALPGP